MVPYKVVGKYLRCLDQSDNPSIKEFDITSCWWTIRSLRSFRWSGTWGYSWEIDDIQLYQTPENDTRIDNYLSYTDYERTLVYEYGAWARSQIPTDLQAAAKVYNVDTQSKRDYFRT